MGDVWGTSVTVPVTISTSYKEFFPFLNMSLYSAFIMLDIELD